MSEPFTKPVYLVVIDDRVILRTDKLSEAADLRNAKAHSIIASVMVGPREGVTKNLMTAS